MSFAYRFDWSPANKVSLGCGTVRKPCHSEWLELGAKPLGRPLWVPGLGGHETRLHAVRQPFRRPEVTRQSAQLAAKGKARQRPAPELQVRPVGGCPETSTLHPAPCRP